MCACRWVDLGGLIRLSALIHPPGLCNNYLTRLRSLRIRNVQHELPLLQEECALIAWTVMESDGTDWQVVAGLTICWAAGCHHRTGLACSHDLQRDESTLSPRRLLPRAD